METKNGFETPYKAIPDNSRGLLFFQVLGLLVCYPVCWGLWKSD